ncbi:MAG: flagellar protein FlaG [Halothiobacillaceae bacterium]|nr:flagellar protein FlaG [Halothiobacillaceae bacterium]
MSVIPAVSNANIPSVAGGGVLSSVGKPNTSAPDALLESATLKAATPNLFGVPATQSDSVKPTKAQVNQVLEELIKRQQGSPTSVQFSVDEKLNQVVIKVVDPTTQKVIRQFPAEEILKMREEMLNFDTKPPAGLLLSEKT